MTRAIVVFQDIAAAVVRAVRVGVIEDSHITVRASAAADGGRVFTLIGATGVEMFALDAPEKRRALMAPPIDDAFAPVVTGLAPLVGVLLDRVVALVATADIVNGAGTKFGVNVTKVAGGARLVMTDDDLQQTLATVDLDGFDIAALAEWRQTRGGRA